MSPTPQHPPNGSNFSPRSGEPTPKPSKPSRSGSAIASPRYEPTPNPRTDRPTPLRQRGHRTGAPALIGIENTVGPTLASLAESFGLSPLIGKPLAIIGDARLSAKSDRSAVTERLLSISGEDTLSCNRKNNSTGRVNSRPDWCC